MEVDTDVSSSLQWYAAGQALPGETANTFEITQGGSFLVEAFTSQGCKSSAELSVQVVELSEITLPNVPQLCEGDAYVMTAQSDGDRFEWTKDGDKGEISKKSIKGAFLRKNSGLMLVLSTASFINSIL